MNLKFSVENLNKITRMINCISLINSNNLSKIQIYLANNQPTPFLKSFKYPTPLKQKSQTHKNDK